MLQVLRNDVLSHHATVDTVNNAATELLESSPGDEASHLRDQLDHLNQSWESLLLKTQERQKLLEAALQQVQKHRAVLVTLTSTDITEFTPVLNVYIPIPYS